MIKRVTTIAVLLAVSLSTASASPDGGTVARVADAHLCDVVTPSRDGGEWACTPSDAGTLGPAWWVSQSQMRRLGQKIEALETDRNRLAEENAALRARQSAPPTSSFTTGFVAGAGVCLLVAGAAVYLYAQNQR